MFSGVLSEGRGKSDLFATNDDDDSHCQGILSRLEVALTFINHVHGIRIGMMLAVLARASPGPIATVVVQPREGIVVSAGTVDPKVLRFRRGGTW